MIYRINEKNTSVGLELEKEIKAIIDREAMAHGVMGDEICNVKIGLTEKQNDIFESYSVGEEFNTLHYCFDGDTEFNEESGLYEYHFAWSETGFVDTKEERIQKMVMDALGYTWRERDHLMKYGEFYIYEAYAWAEGERDWMEDNWKEYADDGESIDDVWNKLYGAYNADDLLEEIKADHFHPRDGRDSVEIEGVWFVIEVAL